VADAARTLRNALPAPVRHRLGGAAIAADRAQAAVRRTWRRSLRGAWRRYHASRYGGTYATSLEHVPTRDQLPLLLVSRGLDGTAVEIGVQRGRYSEFLLAHWTGRRLISVDPWLEAPDEQYVDRANVAQQTQERRYCEAIRRLERFGDRSEIWRTTSVEAARRVEPGTLDFVYVDARHDYASVLEDLESWWPKLKPGAIMAGHDYVDGDLPNGVFGVRSAVDTFFSRLGLRVYATDGRPARVEVFPTWIVEVPR
jgi:predicted O-methyltransferase YrrM